MKIIEYMKMSQLTYRQLSKLWGVGHTTIHHWVSGRAKPFPRHREMIRKKSRGLITFEDQ